MSVFVLGHVTSDDEWCEVCRVEADSADAPATRIVSATDELATETIVSWNMEHYPDLASPRMLAADLGMRGMYGLADALTPTA